MEDDDTPRGGGGSRRRLLSLPGPGGQPPPSPVPRAPAAAADVSSSYHRRFPPSLVLPPVHPAAAAAARLASPVQGFGYCRVPPALAPAEGGGGGGVSLHARSLSQPQFFSMDFLAPSPYADLAAPAPIALSPPPPLTLSTDRAASGLPPLGTGHRRSQSDVLLGFSLLNQMPPRAPVNPEAAAAEGREPVNNNTLDGLVGSFVSLKGDKGLGVVGFSGDGSQERRDHLDSQVRGPPAWSPADSSENEADSADGSMPRHCRSLSADSFVGKLSFGGAGQESSSLPPPSPGAGAAGGLARSGSGSIGGAAALFATDIASCEFSEAEKKKIMANERLAEIVLTDPKRVKRILNNRLSAAKSKERKARYMSELEHKVQVLQMETTTLTAQVTMFQRDHALLSTQNNEIKIRLQAMEQQAQLRNALNEALNSEVQRLKLAAGEISDPLSQQQMSSQMIQLQQLQIVKQPSLAQQDQQQQPQQSARLGAQQQQWNF